MIPGLLSRVLHSCLMTYVTKNKNAPHLMAESGALKPGHQKLKVVLMTITSVTLTQELHYPCQPVQICVEPLGRRIHEDFVFVSQMNSRRI
jgi:hypothetical protein